MGANLHGFGQFNWDTGQIYRGYWKDAQKFCGIETNGSQYSIYLNGNLVETKTASNDYADALLGALIIGGIGYAAYQNPQAFSTPSSSSYRVDTDWDWDLQNASSGNGTTVWVCRGTTTGQYAEHEHCAYDMQDDDRWPGLGRDL